ncbi:hypothetical protein N9260_01360 [bacterium]|nr:hypothetical protein [bacterium]
MSDPYFALGRRQLIDDSVKRVIATPVTGALGTYAKADLFDSTDMDSPGHYLGSQTSLQLVAEQAVDIAALRLQPDMDGKQFGLQATFRKNNAAGAAVAHVEDVTCVADVTDSLNGKFFQLNDDVGSVGVWIDTDDSGTTIPGGASALDRGIEVTGVVTDDSAADVATAVAAAIDADSKFSATADAGVVTVTHATAGHRSDGADGDAGFTFAVATEGENKVLQESVSTNVATIDQAENPSSEFSPQIQMPSHEWDEVAIYLFVPVPTAAALTELTLVPIS